jgi:hypothetical protein
MRLTSENFRVLGNIIESGGLDLRQGPQSCIAPPHGVLAGINFVKI